MTANTTAPDLTPDYIDAHDVEKLPKDDMAALGKHVAKLAMKLAKHTVRDDPNVKQAVYVAIPLLVKSVPADQSPIGLQCCVIEDPNTGFGVHIPC